MDILAGLYLMVGFIFAIAFIPQLRSLWHDRTGAASISLATWAMFSACNIITLLYAISHSNDKYFIFCSSMCTVGNLAVFLLAAYRRATALQPKPIPVRVSAGKPPNDRL